MILLLDAGNTRVKWATWKDGRWLARGAFQSNHVKELSAALANGRPDWVGISCVAGEAVRSGLVEAFAAAGLDPYWLQPASAGHGVVNRYRKPETLGADRYAIAIATFRRGFVPCVAVGVGTAVTIDAIAGDGEFLGGMILPSVALMRYALAVGTAALNNAEGSWRPFPRTTEDGIETGAWTAIAAAAVSMRVRLAVELGRDVGVVVTGGDSSRLVAHLRDIGYDGELHVGENLVLEGLLWVARDLGVVGA